MGCSGSKDPDFVTACTTGRVDAVANHIQASSFEEAPQFKETVNTGLLRAVDNNQLPVVRLLVAKFGKGIVNKNSRKRELGAHNAVTMACVSRNAQDAMLEYLLRDCGGDPNAYEPVKHKTALHLAAAPHLQTAKVSTLVEWGADTETADNDGNTPLDDLRDMYKVNPAQDHDGKQRRRLEMVVEQYRHALGQKPVRSPRSTRSRTDAAERAAQEAAAWGSPPAVDPRQPGTPTSQQMVDRALVASVRHLDQPEASNGNPFAQAAPAQHEQPPVEQANRSQQPTPRYTLLPQRTSGGMSDSLSEIQALGDPAAVLAALREKKAKQTTGKQEPHRPSKQAAPVSFDDELKSRLSQKGSGLTKAKPNNLTSTSKQSNQTAPPEASVHDSIAQRMAMRKKHLKSPESESDSDEWKDDSPR